MTRQPDDLGIDFGAFASSFQRESDSPYVLIRIQKEDAEGWADALGVTVRRCYASDPVLLARAQKLGLSLDEILAAKLPDPGSTMSGDFAEILTYLFQSCEADPLLAVGPKKWRLKQDRTKPAPGSDVVNFLLPDWPDAGTDDRLLCAETKAKATRGTSRPIEAAIRDLEKDRTSRLSRTLVWLRERALLEDLGDVGLDEINRFIEADKHPAFQREYRAVAVICTSLLDEELADAPTVEPSDYAVVVIAVPSLKATYSAVYEAAKRTSLVTQDAEESK